jgi:hypothetical protein
MRGLALLVVTLSAVAADGPGLPPMVQAVSEARLRICAIDKDSPQCEAMAVMSVETAQGKFKSGTTPEERAEFRKAIRAQTGPSPAR